MIVTTANNVTEKLIPNISLFKEIFFKSSLPGIASTICPQTPEIITLIPIDKRTFVIAPIISEDTPKKVPIIIIATITQIINSNCF